MFLSCPWLTLDEKKAFIIRLKKIESTSEQKKDEV